MTPQIPYEQDIIIFDLIGYRFKQVNLLWQALTHRSADGKQNYERLEFLGDAILETVSSLLIYKAFPDATEGELTQLRSYLVCSKQLCHLFKQLLLHDHVILGKGEQRSTSGHEAIFADCFEAIIAAIYLDAGSSFCTYWLEKQLKPLIQDIPNPFDLQDPKSKLQQCIQANNHTLPKYELVKFVDQPEKIFYISCTCFFNEEEFIIETTGSSIKKAEQQAAALMLEKLTEGSTN